MVIMRSTFVSYWFYWHLW